MRDMRAISHHPPIRVGATVMGLAFAGVTVLASDADLVVRLLVAVLAAGGGAFLVLGPLILLGTLWAAPYRQRNEARRRLEKIEQRPSPERVARFFVLVLCELIEGAHQLHGQRRVSGDGWFVDAVVRWAGHGNERLEVAEAGDLLRTWREYGIDGSMTADACAQYLDRSTALFDNARRELGWKEDEIPF